MNKTLAGSLLPVVFAFASLGTVACTADSASSSDVVAREPVAPSAPVEALAGSAKNPIASDASSLPGASETNAGAALVGMRLVVTEVNSAKPVVYSVHEYDFGLDSEQAVASATTGAGAAKPTLRPLQVKLAVDAKSTVLSRSLYGTARIAKVSLERVLGNGTFEELATFDKAAVTRMDTNANDGVTESYDIEAATMTVKHGAARVTVDIATNTTSCAAPCPCQLSGGAGKLGPYTQGGPLAVIPKDSTRIDSLDVELHNTASAGGAGGLAAGKAVLDNIELGADLETSAVCAIYYAGKGSHMDDVRVGVAGPSAPKSSGAESTTWDACLATVKSVEISGASGGPAREALKLAAGGLVRTDRPIDPKNGGVALGQDAKVGWSFVANAPITSCSAVLP
jgi:hypothetical protein